MGQNWIASVYPGVRYREHPTRRHGRNPDRYYSIRYKVFGGRTVHEGIGWASEGWKEATVADIRAAVRKNVRTGTGPQTLVAMREQSEKERQREQARQEEFAAQAVTLGQIAERYVAWAQRNKPKSWKTDDGNLRLHVLPRIGGIPAAGVTLAHLQAIKDALAQTLAPATVKHCLGITRRLFNWAQITPVSTENARPLYSGPNPVKGLVMPRKDNSRTRFLSRAEAEQLLKRALAFDARGQDLHDACLLALYTGLRKGEILRLRWSDVDLTHGVIHVFDSKNTDTGTAPVNALVKAMLERRATVAPGSLVFIPPAGGTRMRMLSHRFAALAVDMGLNDGIEDERQKVCFHTLRHTFASWLALAGVDIYRIKELMRHKTIEQTMRYAHLIPDVKRSAVEALCRPE